MTLHYIIMSSSYTDGKRIAYDVTNKSKVTSQEAKEILEEIKKKSDAQVPLSIHCLKTDDSSWESVVKYDPFFENVEVVDNIDDFAKKIKKDRTLLGRDVANYIVSKVACTHLKLEKLVYFAYADYLCSTGNKLFTDNIYAFKYGPVIDSVYETYKKRGIEETYQEQTESIKADDPMPFKSRILFAKDGVEKIASIEKTLQRYSSFTAAQLVDITHRDGSPWSKTDRSKKYSIIGDETIKAFHQVEYQQ